MANNRCRQVGVYGTIRVGVRNIRILTHRGTSMWQAASGHAIYVYAFHLCLEGATSRITRWSVLLALSVLTNQMHTNLLPKAYNSCGV